MDWVLVESNKVGVFQNVEMGFGEGIQLDSVSLLFEEREREKERKTYSSSND